MKFRSTLFGMALLFAAAPPPARAQETADPGTLIRTETRLVLVDAVVTDKKGNYVRDLEMKDFEVQEDNKKQTLRTFSFGVDPSGPNKDKNHYLVLMFDNSSMAIGDQMRARQEANKFIDANAGPNRLIAIANFGGSLQIAQNFTTDVERLKQVVNGTKISATSTAAANPNVGFGGRLDRVASFGIQSMLYGLIAMSKALTDVPGRKTLVLFTSGFPLNAEIQSQLTAAIDACNKANVAVYPVDVRGLSAPGVPFGPRGAIDRGSNGPVAAFALTPVLRIASFLSAYF